MWIVNDQILNGIFASENKYNDYADNQQKQ